MAAGNFYARAGGASFTSGASLTRQDGSWDADFATSPYSSSSTPRAHHMPPYNHELIGVSQKLDRMMAVMTEQKSAIENGAECMCLSVTVVYSGCQETADPREHVKDLSERLNEVKASTQRLQGSLSVRRKSRVPKDLSVCVVISCDYYMMVCTT